MAKGETLARYRSILTKLTAKNHYPAGHIRQETVREETIVDRLKAQALLSNAATRK